MAHHRAGAAPDARAPRRARVEDLLARYPALSDRELGDLLHWFEREASAFDVATIASDERVRPGYAAFKAEHIEPLGLADLLRLAAAVAAVGAVLLAVGWLAG